MATPTRFPKGSTTVPSTDTLGFYGAQDPSKWHTFFTDFDRYVAADWTVTETGVATQVLTSADDNGVLLITNAAADDDRSFSQLVTEGFQPVAGKRTIFKARFKILEVLQADLVMGLQILDTTPLAVSDGMWFQKDDGDALLDFHVASGSSQTDQTNVHTMVADTFITCGLHYDGKAGVEVYVNDVKVATVVDTNVPNGSQGLSVSYGVQNGEAVINTMSIDYLFAAQER